MSMDKTYDHQQFEENIYKLWQKGKTFTPLKKKGKKPYCIIMPPPNANENLHIGHARFVTIQDILIRHKRMSGYSALWLPGADHAGIETQYVFEKKLRSEGKSRFDYKREVLYKMIWDYSMEKKKTMERQLMALGASCDWSRNQFTLDEDIVKIVYKTFKTLHKDNLVYRGEHIVNYCPLCGTTFSQLEVNHQERKDPLYYLDYKNITIATTRPETIFADVAVAVNPKDKRYQKLIGKTATVPIVEREIPIISDKKVDLDYGTGALKVTPGHDATDFEIGTRHNLSTISVIDLHGKMINCPEEYVGLKPKQAHQLVVEKLNEMGLVKKTENIRHTVGVCYKHKTPIEPLIFKQWFIKTEMLSKNALQLIKNKKINIVSKKYEKIAIHWLKNFHDWNISRQNVWGIRIPAFRCQKCLNWTITEGKAPDKCEGCDSTDLVQDNDTFDTWFSSSQWPFAVLLTDKDAQIKEKGSKLVDENKSSDFNYFYPTSVMETAYDILPFWVLRMIMLGHYATGKVPFKDVLLHGLVRDREGSKISKSKGNVIDPIDMARKYGADAVRMGLIWGALVENDISLSEDNIRGQRNFANKIWNISRFVFMQEKGKRVKLDDSDREIIKKLSKTEKNVKKLIDKYRLNEAAEEIYNFIWNDFANNYLEKSKNRKESAQYTLEKVLKRSLIILHPFMPFITEVIWQEAGERFGKGLLANQIVK